jgi:hypothetical protein
MKLTQDINFSPDDSDEIHRLKTLLQEQERERTYTWTAEKRWTGPRYEWKWVVYQTLNVDAPRTHIEKSNQVFMTAEKALKFIQCYETLGLDPVVIPNELKEGENNVSS